MKFNGNRFAILFLFLFIFALQIVGCSSSGSDSPSGKSSSSSSSSSTSSGTATISLSAEPTSIPADGQSSSSIKASLKDSSGKAVPKGTLATLKTTLGTFSNSSTTLETQTPDDTGEINTSLKSGTTGGTASVTCTSNSVSQKATVEFTETSSGGGVTPGDPASIEVSTIQRDPVYIKNSGKPESSKITYDVKDKNGTPVADGTVAKFSIEGGGVGGGETLTESSSTTTGGKVSTTLKSGTISGTVKVRAEYEKDSTVFTSATITIACGPPYGPNLSVSPEKLNIAGLVMPGLEDIMTTRVTDIYSNNVPDGTSVYFKTDFGGITASDTTKSKKGDNSTTSYALATLSSQTQNPADGFVTVATSTQSGAYARVLCIAVDPNNSAVIYLGTDGGGIFKTTDGGSTWSQIGRPRNVDENGFELTNGIVNDIKFVDPNNSAVIMAATNRGIFETTGGGDKWELISWKKEIKGESIGNLDTTDTNKNGYSKDYALKYISNGVRTKSHIYLDQDETKYYNFIYLDENESKSKSIKFLLMHVSGTPAVTIDYETAVMIPIDYNINSIALGDLGSNPHKTRIIYAGTDGGGVYKSTDGGFSWNSVNTSLDNQEILCLTIDKATVETDGTTNSGNDIIYAGTNGGGIFKTTNGGTTWASVNKGLPGSVINSIAIDPNDSTRIYAATNQYGVYYSADSAANWTAPITNLTHDNFKNTKQVTSFAIHYKDSTTGFIYAGAIGDGSNPLGGVFKSGNRGVDWERVTSLADNHVHSLGIISGSNSDTLFAGTWGRNLFKSSDSGVSWFSTNGNSQGELTNTIFATQRILFSDHTVMDPYLVQLGTTGQGAGGLEYSNDTGNRGYIYNGGTANFVFTVKDSNGNPLTAGSTISVSADKGKASADGGEIGDTQQNKNYYISWSNDITDTTNQPGTLTIKVTSEKNGGYDYSITRTLVRPLAASLSNASPKVNTQFNVYPSGGSETVDSSYAGGNGKGYTVTCRNSTGTYVDNFCNSGDTVSCYAGPTKDVTETVSVKDETIGSSVAVNYTVAAP